MEMAHFRLETLIIGRKAKDKLGNVIPDRETSMLAKAAYRSGQALKDERVDKTFNYRPRTQEVVYSEIMAPASAPDWLKGGVHDAPAGTKKQRELRETLWNTIERVEKRKDSQLAREFIASLPVGLSREQQIELIRGWCEAELVSKGFMVDLTVHKSKDGNNPHAHILVTTRPVEADGFGKKPDTAGKFNGRGAAGLAAKDEVKAWRKSYEIHENAALEKAGRPERVDCRSLKDQGIDREPQPKIGVAASAMKRKGIDKDPERFQLVRKVKVLNDVRPYLRSLLKEGRTSPPPHRSILLERAASFLAEFGERAGRLIDEARERWSNLLDSRRQKSEKSGPER